MAEYTLGLTTDTGARIGGGALNANLGFYAVQAINKAAPLRIVLPPSFDTSLIKADRMVPVWRTPTGGHQYLYGVYIILAYGWDQTADGDLFSVQGYTPPCLLWRRWIAAYAGTSAAEKNDLADDMMKEVVTQSMSDALSPAPTAGTRAWANLTVAADLGDGPTVERGFAWKQLLSAEGNGVLASINKASRQLGTEVFFGVEPNVIGANSINFIFRTYTGQPGIDRTTGPAQVIFSKEQATLTDAQLSYDYTKAQNYIYAAGQGDLSDRKVEQVYDAARYNRSIWGRCEGVLDARNQADDQVEDAGNTALDDRRPEIRLTGKPIDTEGQALGSHWNCGDLVVAKAWGAQFDALVTSTTVTVDENKNESIDAQLEYR